MLRLVGIDSGPLGLLTHPKPSQVAKDCTQWLNALLANEVIVVLPSIADYELRREYLLRQNVISLQKLNGLRAVVEFEPINDDALVEAASLWAQLRTGGQPTAQNKALDIDCIVATQVRQFAASLGYSEDEFVIATTDLGDLPRLAPAANWQEISPLPKSPNSQQG